tara:strand:+ start:1080 stop:1700 length:621 start_codon:yes stop_codon:yes gene_type:complete
MRYYLTHFFVIFFSIFIVKISSAEMTLNQLIFDSSKPFHLKILDALPENAILQVGPDEAENTIIEFMDYFCGYCKKIHPELMKLAEERDDTRVIFLQHPILSESSNIIASMVVAANMQNKGLEFHNELFSIEGSINRKKIDEIINKLEIHQAKFSIDFSKDETKNIVQLSSFLANGSGARGTPTLFINEEFVGGYIPLQTIKGLLK